MTATLVEVPFVSLDRFAPKGDGSDDYTAFRNAIDSLAEGQTLYIPPLPVGSFYGLAQELIIDKHINVLGSVGKLKSSPNVYYGSLIRPVDSTVQSSMASCIHINAASVEVAGLAFQGRGTGSSAAVKFGTSSHGAGMRRVLGENFQSGVVFGSGSNHNTVTRSEFTGNNDAARIAAGNQNDFAFIDSLLDGNTRASVFLEQDTGVQNLLFLRTHLGFSQYGLLQDTATTANVGYTGLKMVASPIEFVSVQHISCKTCGGWEIDRASYWGWNGTPANPAVSCGPVSWGPIDIKADLLPNTPNANSPSVVAISTSASYAVKVEAPLKGFAQAHTSGQKVFNVGSAANISVPPGLEYANVTGTTTITSMTATYAGHRVTLKFAGVLTFTDGGNLVLAGNFVTTADDTITLICDGTNWIETARSVN